MGSGSVPRASWATLTDTRQGPGGFRDRDRSIERTPPRTSSRRDWRLATPWSTFLIVVASSRAHSFAKLLSFTPYIIRYRVADNHVRILRVRHGLSPNATAQHRIV
jgi:hypothetical protein